MPIKPTNCYICKKTWFGSGTICSACMGKTPPPPPLSTCTFCGGPHNSATCLFATTAFQQMMQPPQATGKKSQNPLYTAAMHNKQPKKYCRNCGSILHKTAHCRYRTFQSVANRAATNYPLKPCPNCRGNHLIESKAGSVCAACKTVVHNPCRECSSNRTIGLKGDGVQFIECQDCKFIE